MHDVGEVDPLVAISVTVLRRVRCRARHLADSDPLRVVRADEHRRLPVASARGLRADRRSVQVSRLAWLRPWAHARLDYVDVARTARLALLDIAEEALHFLVAVR